MNEKKYEMLEDDTINFYGRTLHRIKALKDFGDIKKGNLGGFIEKEENLSHDGKCWVYGSARVYGSAWVGGSARVYGSAWVSGSAVVYGSAWVGGSARVYDSAWVYGSARVYDSAVVYGSAWVGGSADIRSKKDLIVATGLGSEQRSTTFFKSKKGAEGKCGCFLGTLDEFKEKVVHTHKDTVYAKQYLAMADIVEMSFKASEADE